METHTSSISGDADPPHKTEQTNPASQTAASAQNSSHTPVRKKNPRQERVSYAQVAAKCSRRNSIGDVLQQVKPILAKVKNHSNTLIFPLPINIFELVHCPYRITFFPLHSRSGLTSFSIYLVEKYALYSPVIIFHFLRIVSTAF